MLTRLILPLLCAAFLPLGSVMAEGAYQHLSNKGGFFYYSPIKKPQKARPLKPLVVMPRVASAKDTKQKPHAINCYDPQQWKSSCGFVTPQSYAFEQKEYKALLPSSVMGYRSPQKVHEWLKFQDWALDVSMGYAYMTQYVRLQNPRINPEISAPISQFGNNMIRHINDDNRAAYVKALADHAILVMFTRHGDKGTRYYCPQCQAMAPILIDLSKKTGIPLREASLDGKHFDGIADYHTAPETIIPAQILRVAVVPTTFIYLKPSPRGAARWIRVSIGLEAEDTIRNRIARFVAAFRQSIIDGAREAQKARQVKAKGGHALPKQDTNAPDFTHMHPFYFATHGTASEVQK